MNTEKKKWVFIINPVAGNGFAATLEKKIRSIIAKKDLDADIIFTERKGHAGELSEKYALAGYSYIIGVGGDGTFNEIITPLVGLKNIITGLIPAGTGNDFIQITGFPGRLDELGWEQFFDLNIIALDAGRCNGRYFVNGMGLGFDAQVAAENYTLPGEVKRGGKNKYIWHILKTLLFFREKRMTVITDNVSIETECFINTISNGRRFAGGFFLTPLALANDGLLDICSIKRLSLLQRLRILLMVPSGKHINDKKVNYYKTEKVTLRFNSEVPYHVDGELFFADNFEVDIVPAALTIIYNPAGKHFFKISV